MSNGLREKVARLLCAINDFDPDDPVDVRFFYQSADDTIALVLEEAAKEVERMGRKRTGDAWFISARSKDDAAAIRALKDKA